MSVSEISRSSHHKAIHPASIIRRTAPPASVTYLTVRRETDGVSAYDPASVKTHLYILFSRYDCCAFLRRDRMKRFAEGTDRGQSTLLPECLEDWIGEDKADIHRAA